MQREGQRASSLDLQTFFMHNITTEDMQIKREYDKTPVLHRVYQII